MGFWIRMFLEGMFLVVINSGRDDSGRMFLVGHRVLVLQSLQCQYLPWGEVLQTLLGTAHLWSGDQPAAVFSIDIL